MVTEKNKRKLNYYLTLPWTYIIEEDIDNHGKKIFVISINELPGIQTHGYNTQEAFESIKEVLHGTIELYLKLGKRIPEPKRLSEKKLKGNIPYRTTQETHYRLAKEAKRLKKPINKLIDEFVNKGLLAKAKKK